MYRNLSLHLIIIVPDGRILLTRNVYNDPFSNNITPWKVSFRRYTGDIRKQHTVEEETKEKFKSKVYDVLHTDLGVTPEMVKQLEVTYLFPLKSEDLYGQDIEVYEVRIDNMICMHPKSEFIDLRCFTYDDVLNMALDEGKQKIEATSIDILNIYDSLIQNHDN